MNRVGGVEVELQIFRRIFMSHTKMVVNIYRNATCIMVSINKVHPIDYAHIFANDSDRLTMVLRRAM